MFTLKFILKNNSLYEMQYCEKEKQNFQLNIFTFLSEKALLVKPQ